MRLGTVRTFAVIASDLWPLNRAFLWRVSWTLLGSFAGPVSWWFALNRRNQWRLFYAVARRRLHSCLLNHYVSFTINRALPPLRSAPANAAREWRIGPETDPKASSCRFAVFFCVATAFFCGLVPGEPGGDGVWVRQPSAVGQQNVLRAPEEPETCALYWA